MNNVTDDDRAKAVQQLLRDMIAVGGLQIQAGQSAYTQYGDVVGRNFDAAYAKGRREAVEGIRVAVAAEQLREDLDNESDNGYRSGIADALAAIDAYEKGGE